MEGNGQKPLRIIEFRAQKVMALKAIQIYPEDKDVVILTGRNRQGKSTVIRAIWAALGGKKFIPEEVIRKGEKEASIHLNLGEFIVTLKVTPKKEYLEVRTKDGMKPNGPQGFLQSRLANLAHNPLEFMRLKAAEQVDALQRMLDLKLDRTKLESIAGSWTKKVSGDDPIRVIDEVVRLIFDERTGVNREIKRLEGVIESIEIPKDKENLKVVPVSELFSERKVLEGQKQKNDEIRRNAEKLKNDLEAASARVLNKDREIADLEARLAAAKKERGALIQTVSDFQDQYFAAADEADALIDPDFTSIDARIAKVDDNNRKANEIAQLKATLKKAQGDLATSQRDSDRLTSQIDTLKAYKLDLIEKAGLPLSGLAIEDGQVTFNGLPLSQASGREQIEISCAICLAQHPQIGIITIDVGWGELDESGKAVIREFARKTGAQIWVTQVREEPGQEGFHIVDGELVAVDGEMVCEDITEDMPDEQQVG